MLHSVVENDGLSGVHVWVAQEGGYSLGEWEGQSPFLVSCEEEEVGETESFCDPHVSLEGAEGVVSQIID